MPRSLFLVQVSLLEGEAAFPGEGLVTGFRPPSRGTNIPFCLLLLIKFLSLPRVAGCTLYLRERAWLQDGPPRSLVPALWLWISCSCFQAPSALSQCAAGLPVFPSAAFSESRGGGRQHSWTAPCGRRFPSASHLALRDPGKSSIPVSGKSSTLPRITQPQSPGGRRPIRVQQTLQPAGRISETDNTHLWCCKPSPLVTLPFRRLG